MPEFRTNKQTGKIYPISDSNKSYRPNYKDYRRNVEYTTFEERYFDCPVCGSTVSDHGNILISDDSLTEDEWHKLGNSGDPPYKPVDIEKGAEGRCPDCGTKIRVTGSD